MTNGQPLEYRDGFVFNPDPFYSPSFRISPFRTADIADNLQLPRSVLSMDHLDCCFQGRHWESLEPRPPEYGYKQEGPVQFQWVAIHGAYDGDGFLGKPVTGCTASNDPCPERNRGETSSRRTLPIMPFR